MRSKLRLKRSADRRTMRVRRWKDYIIELVCDDERINIRATIASRVDTVLCTGRSRRERGERFRTHTGARARARAARCPDRTLRNSLRRLKEERVDLYTAALPCHGRLISVIYNKTVNHRKEVVEICRAKSVARMWRILFCRRPR